VVNIYHGKSGEKEPVVNIYHRGGKSGEKKFN
jgi:hypothetical protein